MILKIADLAEVIMGQSPNGEDVNAMGVGDPLLNGPTEFGLYHPTPVQWTTKGKKFADPGDTLLCVRGSTTGKMNIADRRYAIGRGVAAIRSKYSLYGRFVYYALQNAISELLLGVTGSVFPNVSRDQILDTKLHAPESVEERRLVAEVLRALDDKIAADGCLSGVLEQLMLTLVSRLPREAELDEIAVQVKAPVKVSNMLGKEISHYSLPAFDEERLPAVGQGSEIKSSKLMIKHSSVLLSKLNPRFPRVWRVENPEENSVASTEFIVLEPKDIPVSALWAVLAGDFTSRYLSERTTGTSGSHQRVRPDEIMSIPVPSSMAFSQVLADHLLYLGKRVDNARSESRTLASLRDTLLPALMNGTLRVKDAEKQVSEVL